MVFLHGVQKFINTHPKGVFDTEGKRLLLAFCFFFESVLNALSLNICVLHFYTYNRVFARMAKVYKSDFDFEHFAFEHFVLQHFVFEYFVLAYFDFDFSATFYL